MCPLNLLQHFLPDEEEMPLLPKEGRKSITGVEDAQ
jgi:hypothetical protein